MEKKLAEKQLDGSYVNTEEGIEYWKSQQSAQLQALRNAEQAKRDTEFSRYKQDCRKRALDLAFEIFSKQGYDTNDEGEKETDIRAIADKYYQWLIEIPQ